MAAARPRRRFPVSDAAVADFAASMRDNLLNAAHNGDLRLLKRLVVMLDEGVGRPKDVVEAARADGGLWALHVAAGNEQMEVCRYLVQELRVDVNAADDKGRTPLVFAVHSENAAVVNYLLDHGADPDKADDVGLTPLHSAAGIGDCEMIEMLLAKGARIDLIADDIGTPLHLATKEQHVNAMKTLLDHNADLCRSPWSYKSLEFMTPLFQAVNLSSVECVKLLVEAGAVINSDCVSTASVDSKMGNEGSTECLNFLLEARANRNASNDDKHGNTEKITHLKSFGSQSIKRKDYFSASAFYTKAIDLDPADATLFSNRSFCWLRMGDGKKALLDALECRKLRPDWLKACYRHGAALMLLEDYEGACQALLDGLKLDPQNAEMETALREAMESLKTCKGTRAR
ncbi:serine/threonine-protein phosphatase 6 regulatory ankyrin repeat subunit B-like [Lolium rigidum]|uniref:serine/threonine-protein phosphatase 6 regulatory ankyrin repeat subunit B-like n=1 Tax=Lolium rigidum TaxID=89674 RepID=UPI001F5C801C|nr:serine/threonine-protein phosphatase 6 regulatory ankyrin repeat subunit B-like [Lolium rigidum]